MSKARNKVVTFGEVMLRLSTQGNERFRQASTFAVTFAGAEANVAASLSMFGVPAAHVTVFPDHELGHAAAQTLAKYGVDTSHILYGGERLGLYYLENGAMQRATRLIYDRFDSSFSKIRKGAVDWKEVLKDAAWFHYTGITPAISQGAADVCLEAVRAARALDVTVSGDINYRRNLWQYGKSPLDVMPALIEHTDVMVAGVTDLLNCCDIHATSFEDACKKAKQKFPAIRIIASTKRESVDSTHNVIEGILWDEKQLLSSARYDLTHIVDRIGAGDAFMSGLIYALMAGKSHQQCIDFASAACAWKHSVPGDANIATVAEIEALAKGENVGKLLR